jgi:succinyl-diaminopimelate desuccinylase
MEFIQACRKFIELESTPDNGNLELARFAADLCREAGLSAELHVENYNGIEQANVVARPMIGRPANEVMLQTHLDTGDPGSYALWTKTGANPFNASIYPEVDRGDVIYGLGAANVKLDFLCKLEAVKSLVGARWRVPVVLVGTFGEELGMQGAVKLIRKKQISPSMALIGEPTSLELIHAGKGYAAVEIEIPFSAEEIEFRENHDLGDGTTTQSRIFLGKASHSAFPQLGDSAVTKLLDYLAKLPSDIAVMEIEAGISFNTIPAQAVLEFDTAGGLTSAKGERIASRIAKVVAAIKEVERRLSDYPDSEFTPPEPTLSIGVVRTYDEHIKFSGCCRLPPSVSNELYEEWMEILRRACHDAGAVFRVTDYKRPFRTALSSTLLSVCQEELVKLGRSGACGAQAVTTEANVFSRFGIECVVIGPGQGVGNSHAPNENVKLNELQEAIRFYQGVLRRVCL